MWGSNVVRLRRCLSTVQRVRCKKRWYSSVSARTEPVSQLDFVKALEAVYARNKWEVDNALGFAVSGGVDSMALATLYHTARQANEALPRPHGIIVDHKARPESTEEAEWVAEQLRSKLNMRSSIVSLAWPEAPDSLNKNRFETDARVLRYQALGRACRANGITSLMVAHHADDQAETLIMRMIKGRLRSGLQGMQPVEWIPECHGIYGVHHSGGVKSKAEAMAESKLPFPIESGGMQILRPLLGIEKSRLIATCKEQGIEWAEDKTNKDPTLTTRNAVRHIVQNYKLPAALSQSSLTNLSQHMQNRLKSHHKTAQKAFDRTLMDLDIQTGSIIVRFPPSRAFIDGRPVKTESDKKAARNTAYLYLQKVTELVIAHKAPGTAGQLSRALDFIWPTLRIDNDADVGVRDSFTTNKIWFRFWDKPSPFERFPHHDGMEWMLTRQPLEKQEIQDTAITIPSGSTSRSSKGDWHLFDNRYWIRIANKSANDLVIRAVTHADIETLSQTKDASQDVILSRRHLKAVLNLVKPADLRYNIPAIFQKSVHANKPDRLIALPSFRVYLELPGDLSISSICDFDVRYQKLDLGRQRPRDIIRGFGLTRKAIRDESWKVLNSWKLRQQAGGPPASAPKKRRDRGSLKDMLEDENVVEPLRPASDPMQSRL